MLGACSHLEKSKRFCNIFIENALERVARLYGDCSL